ncbi:GTP-binding protein ERG isoform X2 [Morus notabilis]|uniref:GTP-binding protein ERG isoform X2 n=1 Tax=Morus notabilis TaxID=981085 RepID=UPI000CED1679|nr:GTP-binding protein ERG isoform X2 [Morus notabilis]
MLLRMKALRALRTLTSLSSNSKAPKIPLNPSFPFRFYAAQPQEDDPSSHPTFSDSENASDSSVFDSSHYAMPGFFGSDATAPPKQPTWDKQYRAKADEVIFGKKKKKKKKKTQKEEEEEEEEVEEEKRRALAKALLEAALEAADDDEDDEEEDGDSVVKEEDQKSLSVGIVGAPNAGKSALTNYMVGTKVAAVSRKTNTTTHEVLGVMTKGNTQICFFDTPGLTLTSSGQPYKDIKVRVESAWSSVQLYDAVIVIFDVHRHITRHFMISGLKGSGVKDLTQYLMEQAVKRPWDEDPFTMSEEVRKNIALEVVRERLLDHVHQEVPYGIEHRLVDWKELRDGSLRIEQHFITPKLSQRKILVGKKGSKIGRIGIEANEELRSIFKREVHLILQVKLK